MKTWDREEVVSGLLPRLWDFLANHARHVDSYIYVDDLLGLDAGSIQRLAASRLLDPRRVEPMLGDIETHLRGLPSSARREVRESRAGIRGRIDWPNTLRLRITTSDPLVVRTAVVERAYDTWTSRVLKFALSNLIEMATLASFGGAGELGNFSTQVRESATRLMRHAKLAQARDISFVPAQQLDRFRERTHLADVADFVDDCQCVTAMSDLTSLKRLLGRSVLAPVTDDKLYELLVGFRLIDAFEENGYHERRDNIRGLAGVPFSVLEDSCGDVVSIWKEASVFDLREASSFGSVFAETLYLAGVPRSSLRPDFLVEFETRPCLIVEVKHTLRTGKTRDRDGIRDAMAYLKDAEDLEPDFNGARALVVAYGTPAKPHPSAEIMVADEDGVSMAVKHVLSTIAVVA